MAKGSVDRRDFLKGAAVTGAAALVPAQSWFRGRGAAAGDASGTVPRHRRDRGSRSGSGRGRRSADHGSAGRRLHGRRAEVAELRLHRLQPRFELPRHPRIDHQLRQQHQARIPHVLPRRIVGRDGARLLQGRGQADGGAVPRHGRPAARGDGDLQRLLRPRAGLHPRGQHARCDDAAPGRRVGPQRPGRRLDGPRLHQVGRQLRSRCRTSPSRRCAPTRSR